MSGLNNYYKYNLQNTLEGSPIVNLQLYTSRVNIEDNYLILGIKDMETTSLNAVSTYVQSRLGSLGAQLITYKLPPNANEVLEGRALKGSNAPYYIKISKVANARAVIGNLFSYNEMSANNRSEVEIGLRELEKCATICQKTSNAISVAQKDVIVDLTRDYVKAITDEAPNSQTAIKWLRHTAILLKTMGIEQLKHRVLKSFLYTVHRSGHDKSDAFYDTLIGLARFYSSMGNLEQTFEQLGEGIPSNEIVKQTIEALFGPSQEERKS